MSENPLKDHGQSKNTTREHADHADPTGVRMPEGKTRLGKTGRFPESSLSSTAASRATTHRSTPIARA